MGLLTDLVSHWNTDDTLQLIPLWLNQVPPEYTVADLPWAIYVQQDLVPDSGTCMNYQAVMPIQFDVYATTLAEVETIGTAINNLFYNASYADYVAVCELGNGPVHSYADRIYRVTVLYNIRVNLSVPS